MFTHDLERNLFFEPTFLTQKTKGMFDIPTVFKYKIKLSYHIDVKTR